MRMDEQYHVAFHEHLTAGACITSQPACIRSPKIGTHLDSKGQVGLLNGMRCLVCGVDTVQAHVTNRRDAGMKLLATCRQLAKHRKQL